VATIIRNNADPNDQPDYSPVFSLLQIWGYSEKTGISLLWFRTDEGIDLDIHGRSALGFFSYYGRPVIELLWLRIFLA